MVVKNNKRTISAALSLLLLSVGVASMIAISMPHNASAQGLPNGTGEQQSGQSVSGAQEADTGGVAASLDDIAVGQPGGGAESSPCTPSQTAGASIQNATTANATTATTDGTTAINNNTAMLGGEGDTLSASQIRDHIEQACIALEVGDREGALMQLDFAIGELGGDETQSNNTSTSSGEGGEGTFNETVSVGGTGPFDDYDSTPDD